MPRKRKTTPRFTEHPQSGRARVRYWDASGKLREQIMPRAFESKESKDAFARRVLELNSSPAASIATR